MTRALHNGIVPQTCGVGVSGFFRKVGGTAENEISAMPNSGGAGWHIASFTNSHLDIGEAYKAAYKELRERWQIVFQSKVRVNTRTGNKFFFCVYDTKKVNVDNSEFKWPTTGLSA